MITALFMILPAMLFALSARPRPAHAAPSGKETGPGCDDDHPLAFAVPVPIMEIDSGSLRRCFDSFPDILFIKDLEGRFTFCNTAFERACGRLLPDVLGKTVEELNLPHPLDTMLCIHDGDVLQAGMPFFSEVTERTAQGKSLRFACQSGPDITPDGVVRGLFGMCRDISLEKATAEALQRQNSLQQTANAAALLLFSDEEELDDVAWRVLGAIGQATGADRVDIWRNHDSSGEGLLCTQVYRWHAPGSPDASHRYANTVSYYAHLPGWEEQLSSGSCINTFTRPLSAQERNLLDRQGLSEVLVAPILFRSTFWGFIRLGVHSKEHLWSRGEEAILRSVGLLLAATMQRRQIQQDLTESEQRFRDVTMAAGEIVWELDAQGYFSYISERLLDLTGFLPEEALGMRWEDFTPAGHIEEITGRMFQSSAATGFFRAFEHRIRRKEGRDIWLYTSGKLLTGPDGIAGLRGTSLDITHDRQTSENLNTTLEALENANKELELSAERAHSLARKAESASKAKSEFLANMSHEIRTPLNAIIGMAYLTKKTDISPKQEDYLNKIHAAGITLLGVVNDILDFSKIESGELEIEHRPFNLGELFENLASITGAKAEEQGLNIAFFIQRDVPRFLVGDSLRLVQVLTNLVDNAVKFTEKGGITVRCSLESIQDAKACLRFIVSDTGIGITEEQQRKLFQSFSQIDSSITRKYGGTGLGLVIARNLLHLTGGSLALESSPNRGTLVTVDVALDIDQDALEASASSQERPLQNVFAIAIEPDARQREFLADMLRDSGCRVSAFSDMAQGFAATANADTSRDPCRLFILPKLLVEKENAHNLTHLFEGMHLSRPPLVVVLVPFDHTEAEAATFGPEASRRIAATIAKPVISTTLEDTLTDLIVGQCTQDMAAQAESASCMPYFPGSRVLLVEDNPVNQQIATELLRELGITVTVADNGLEAVTMLEESPIIPFQLILMDLQMPEMDGFTATRRIRSNPRMAGLPIIAMTAHATTEERDRCLQAGMNEHIAKPIDVSALHATLRWWLKTAQASPERGVFSASSLEAAQSLTLPELPGLAAEDALQRLKGNKSLYKELLLRFFQHYADSAQDFSSALAKGDMEKAERMAHTIKGLASTLGANALARSAAALENAMRRSSGELEEHLSLSFLTELAGFITMLRRAFPEPLQSARVQNMDCSPDLALEISRLNSLLRDDDAAACALFSSLEARLKVFDPASTATAAKALAVFDFSTALSVLIPMEKGLSATCSLP